MLTSAKHEEFGAKGVIVVPEFLSDRGIQSLKEAMDDLQADTPYTDAGRWDLRNCLIHHQSFVDLLVNEELLGTVVQLLGFNIKLLGSQIVKMQKKSQAESLTLEWHRDGGVLSAELPDPLPPAFIKVGFCISGSSDPEGGELLMVPGSHRLIGEPVVDPNTSWPLGVSKLLLRPGDAAIFDWRTWHAVNHNASNIVRRMLYFTFGYRWLAPMDYEVMPRELFSSPIHKQILGSATELGNYLPSEGEVPLKAFESLE